MTPGKIPDVSSLSSTPTDSEDFFQFEPAVVLDVILDSNHPHIKNTFMLGSSNPPQKSGGSHEGLQDLSYIGRIKARMLYSQKGEGNDNIRWALPLHPTTTEIPLINEIVHLVDIRGKLYYTNRVYHEHNLNYSGDFSAELYSSGFGRPIEPNSFDKPEEYIGPKINLTFADKEQKKNFGVGGKYFSFNRKIRRLKRYEGDFVIESRFGQSIRFGTYDETTSASTGKNLGNPQILIRNKQSGAENHFYSTILEDINKDGSSIQITSGTTESKLRFFTKQENSHYKKKIFSADQSEEQAGFSPGGSTNWKLPTLTGNQIAIFSDRILIGSRANEVLIFSKNRLGLKTDTEFTVDSHHQIVMTTNEKTVINSPFIYLGEYDQTKEPAVLGQTMIEWLYDLGQWLKKHTHYYHHSHPDAGGAIKPTTQKPVEQAALDNLLKQLPTTLSKRVFVTGGGYAPGFDGGSIGGNDGRIGKVQNIPGGYFVPSTGSFEGNIEQQPLPNQ